MYVNTHKKFLKEDPKDTNWNASSGDWGVGKEGMFVFTLGNLNIQMNIQWILYNV